MNEWKDFFEDLGVRTRMIEKSDKVTYHAACTIASNLICAMMQESMELLQICGFSQEEAMEALSPLARSNMERILTCGPVTALTGPVERCDTSTVKKHLECLHDVDDRQMYATASRKLISMAKEKHPERNYESMEDLFQGGLQL